MAATANCILRNKLCMNFWTFFLEGWWTRRAPISQVSSLFHLKTSIGYQQLWEGIDSNFTKLPKNASKAWCNKLLLLLLLEERNGTKLLWGQIWTIKTYSRTMLRRSQVESLHSVSVYYCFICLVFICFLAERTRRCPEELRKILS